MRDSRSFGLAAFTLIATLPLGCIVAIDDPPPIDPPQLPPSLSRCLLTIDELGGRTNNIRSCVYIDQLPCALHGEVRLACPRTDGCFLERLQSSPEGCVAPNGGLIFDSPETLQSRVAATVILVHSDAICPDRDASCNTGSMVPGRTRGECFAKAQFDFEFDDEGRLAPAEGRPKLEVGSFFEAELEGRNLITECADVNVLEAPQDISSRTVRVTLSGPGAGEVISDDPSLECRERKERGPQTTICSATLPEGGTLALEAIPDQGAVVDDDAWQGCDEIVDGKCLARTSNEVTVTFDLQRHNVSVLINGPVDSSGQVVSDVVDDFGSPIIDCIRNEGRCGGRFTAGDTVTLNARDNADGFVFKRWGGACAPYGARRQCRLLLDGDLDVTADFGEGTIVEVNWTGPGRVQLPDSLDCPHSPCEVGVPLGETLQLQALPDQVPGDPDAVSLLDWSGVECSGPTCALTPDGQPIQLTARFGWRLRVTLGIEPLPRGQTGRLTSSPSGIDIDFANLGGDDTYFEPGTEVRLIAQPGRETEFAGWNGDCATFGTDVECTLTMDGPKYPTYAVCVCKSITVQLNGSGTVRAVPADLVNASECTRQECRDPHTCKFWYESGTTVTLETITSTKGDASLGHSWTPGTGWQGAGCTGTGTCTVTVSDDVNVAMNLSYEVQFLRDIYNGILYRAPTPESNGRPGRCSFCHNPASEMLDPTEDAYKAWQTGLFYSLSPPEVRKLIVEAEAKGRCSRILGQRRRINEIDIENSLFLRYPLPEPNGCPDHGLRFAFSGTDDVRYLNMRSWIAGGCRLN